MAMKPHNKTLQAAVPFGPRGFVVRVPDDAMRPAFRAGDFAYVDPDAPVVPGRSCASGAAGRRR